MPTIRQGATGLRESLYTCGEHAALEIDSADVEAIDLVVGTENEDFTFNQETEDAEGGGASMDDDDGVTAQWSPEVTKRVRAVFAVVVDEGLGGPENTDLVSVGVYVNEVQQLAAANGLDEVTLGAITFTGDGILTVVGGSTIRLALFSALGNETDVNYDIATASSEFDLIPVD